MLQPLFIVVSTALLTTGCTTDRAQTAAASPVATVTASLDEAAGCGGDCGCEGVCSTDSCSCGKGGSGAISADDKKQCSCTKCERECKKAGECKCKAGDKDCSCEHCGDGKSCDGKGCKHHKEGESCDGKGCKHHEDGESCDGKSCKHHEDGKSCDCGGEGQGKSSDAGVHSCPMHRDVQQPGEGVCPKCKMKLEKGT